MQKVALSSSGRMDCIITFKILFKILGTLPLQACLNEPTERTETEREGTGRDGGTLVAFH